MRTIAALVLAATLLPACRPRNAVIPKPAVERWIYEVKREGKAPDSPAEEMSKSAHALELRAALIGIEGARVLAGVDSITVDLPALDDETAARLKSLFERRGVLEFIPVADDEAKHKALADAATSDRSDAAAGVRVETDVWFAPGTHREHRLPHLAAADRATLEAVLDEIDAAALVAPLSVAVGESAPAKGGGGPRWRTWLIDRRQGLLDPLVVRADAETSRTASQPQVSVEFTPDTAKRFGELTRKRQGQKLAILIDGEVESAPIIQEPILNGRAIVSMGRDTPKDATDLAVVLGSGRLPYDIERKAVVDKRTGKPPT